MDSCFKRHLNQSQSSLLYKAVKSLKTHCEVNNFQPSKEVHVNRIQNFWTDLVIHTSFHWYTTWMDCPLASSLKINTWFSAAQQPRPTVTTEGVFFYFTRILPRPYQNSGILNKKKFWKKKFFFGNFLEFFFTPGV